MIKKPLTLLITSLLAMPALATQVDNQIHGGGHSDLTVKLDPIANSHVVALYTSETRCTGTVIARNWVLTAGHCGFRDDQVGAPVSPEGAYIKVSTPEGERSLMVERFEHHPEFVPSGGSDHFDISLWHLKTDSSERVGYLTTQEPIMGSMQKITGIQPDDGLEEAQAQAVGFWTENEIPVDPAYGTNLYHLVFDEKLGIGTGTSEPGDSGSPVFNDTGIWGVNWGDNTHVDQDGYYRAEWRIPTLTKPFVYEWVLATINSWNYPATVNGEGELAIKVQNLQTLPDIVQPTAEQGLTLVGHDCNATLDPFGVCTIRVSGSGVLRLSDADIIEVNAIEEETTPPPTTETPSDGDSDSGGGSLGGGLIALLGLVAFWRRWEK